MKKWIQATGITASIIGVGALVAFIPVEVGAAIVATLLLVAVTATIQSQL